ncbi:Rv3654c family TadE-like protein [Psychromicrobium sp. YIM B11713]|uniref:Rv3654c family TadE-like protein n=1 Tax=Psychromicrobium sp. YIM B11713 TaxID=3145233 RepID=UPI00374FC4CD
MARPLERGSGSVLVVGLAAVAVIALCAALLLVQAASAAQQAATAADLAALAAADAARGLNEGDPCEVAESVVLRQGAQLNGCQVLGPMFDTVEVHTAVSFPPILRGFFDQAVGQARAGPPGKR